MLDLEPSEADAFKFAGGLEPEAGVGTLSIRRRDPSGSVNALNVAATPEAMVKVPMRKGDILSALPQREVKERIVQLEGWVRLPGTYERADGLRVGDLLKRDGQVLPTTYRARGEIIRTLPDNTTRYLAFDVDKALGGDPAHNVLLENRDRGRERGEEGGEDALPDLSAEGLPLLLAVLALPLGVSRVRSGKGAGFALSLGIPLTAAVISRLVLNYNYKPFLGNLQPIDIVFVRPE